MNHKRRGITPMRVFRSLSPRADLVLPLCVSFVYPNDKYLIFSLQPPSVTSIPQASDTSSGRDEPPISSLPFTFSKPPMPTVTIPPPATDEPSLQPPTIAFVPPTPEGPQTNKPSEPTVPNFFSTSQIFTRTGVTPPSDSVTKPEPEVVPQVVDADSKPDTEAATDTSATPAALGTARHSMAPVSAPTPSAETQKPSPAPTPFNFGPPQPIQSTSSTQSSTSSLPFSLTPLSAPQLSEKGDAGLAPKPLFGGATTAFPGFGTSLSVPEQSTKPATQTAETATPFSFSKVATPAPAESVEPLKSAFSLAPSPSLTSTSVSGSALPNEAPEPPKSSTPFAFLQPAKETATATPSTAAKSTFA